MRWALRERPRQGETLSGDRAVIVEDGARSTFVVIDVLGHGPNASALADTAGEAVRKSAGSVSDAIGAMGNALRGTRGAAALVLVVDGPRLMAGGVGNIELRADRVRLSVALVPGIVGGRHATPVVFEGSATPRGRIAIFSDGVSQRLDIASVREHPLDEAADLLFASHATPVDDATLLLIELDERP